MESEVEEIVTVVENVPVLRFPEFEEEWVRKNIGSIAIKVGSGSTPPGGEKVYQKSGIPFIRSQNVNDNQLLLDNVSFISEEIYNRMKSSAVYPNDILLNITGGSIGRSCVVPRDFKIGNVNQHVCIIRMNEENVSSFLQAYLSSYKGQKSLERSQVGSGREGLNFQSIRSIRVAVPDYEEQQKIASFLTAVDDKIKKLAKKTALLQKYKEGVMEQLFSQQIRFKDENGQDFPEWEEKSMAQLMTVPEKVKAQEIDVNKLITVKLHLKGVLKNSSTEGLIIGATTYYIRRKGQFIFGKQNLFNGALGVIPDELDGFLSSGDLPCLDINYKKLDPKFLIAYLGRESFYKRLEDIASGTGSKRIHENIFLKIRIMVPSLKEQSKIAHFFHSIDNKIDFVTNQLEQAKQFKKGLLQQMFV